MGRTWRWTRFVVIAAAVAVLLVVVVLLVGGGGHGPARHVSAVFTGQVAPAAAVISMQEGDRP
jgi:hypothetical protein